MVNSRLRRVFGRELILYDPHRNSLPLVNRENRKKYVFLSYLPIWRATRVFGRDTGLRHRCMAAILSFLKPVYIIDINWLGGHHQLFHDWCREHRPSRFIVVQHGLYLGGIITDDAHKRARCDIMLCWGDHSIEELTRHNPSTDTLFVRWGNPVYNSIRRDSLDYKEVLGARVLVAPSVLGGARKASYEELIARLSALGFQVDVKEHNYQARLGQRIEGGRKVMGDLYRLLRMKNYDLVVSDVSTSLIDALYFKNRVLFFSPAGELPEYRDNAYSRHLTNQADSFREWNCQSDVLGAVDLLRQEDLLREMVCVGGDNDLTRLDSPRLTKSE